MEVAVVFIETLIIKIALVELANDIIETKIIHVWTDIKLTITM